MAVRKQRATTSKTYAMDICYTKALADASGILLMVDGEKVLSNKISVLKGILSL